MALSEARRKSLLAYCRIEEPSEEELLTLPFSTREDWDESC